MLSLKLRDEFLGEQLTGTAISLRRNDGKGATEQDAKNILDITYPTADVITALKNISAKRAGRPVVLMGDRGRGKSHILAVLHHSIEAAGQVQTWAKDWGNRLHEAALTGYESTKGFIAITEPVQNQEFPFLWDLIFSRHPKGDYFKGQFDLGGHYMPSRSLLEEMFKEQPTALILDEFQTWFDGLPDATKDKKPKEWAFNFVQMLSELAADKPEHFLLVVSVLNNETDAFKQIHRNHPVLVDFSGPSARKDRQKMVLHRLFVNREQIGKDDILSLVKTYGDERFKLLHSHKSEAERDGIINEAAGIWPFTPELLTLLEDHILKSAAAQGERDLIRILAEVFRAQGENLPVISPADFSVDQDSFGVQALIDSIATHGDQDKLREIAINNLDTVNATGAPIPHARELLSALWMRSLSPAQKRGGSRQELQLDITKDQPIDPNAFQGELLLLIDSSGNIHGDEDPTGPLWLGLEENPRSKVRASAKNDKLWRAGAVDDGSGLTTYPGQDIEHIRKTLKAILTPEHKQAGSKVIVLGPSWKNDPWSEVEDSCQPDRWESPVLVVIPEPIQKNGKPDHGVLGKWIKDHVQKKRNTVRFLILAAGEKGLFSDDELKFSARCSFLTSKEAWGKDPEYWSLNRDFKKPLEDALKARFDRFAILRDWNFQAPDKCKFEIEKIGAQGGEIPSKVEEKLRSDLFDPEDFKTFILHRAKDNYLVGDVLDELAEPPTPGKGEAIPYLGTTQLYERVMEVAAKGLIALNVSGNSITRLPDHETDADALRHIQQRATRTGKELREIKLILPGQVNIGQTVTGVGPQDPDTPTVTPPGPGPAPPPVGPGPGPIPPPGPGPTPPPPGAGEVVVQKTEGQQSNVNLIGSFEKWGIPTEATLKATRIEFEGLTVQQVKQILQRIPSAFKASMEIEYEDEES